MESSNTQSLFSIYEGSRVSNYSLNSPIITGTGASITSIILNGSIDIKTCHHLNGNNSVFIANLK